MADTKITALTAITTVDPAADVLPIVDVSDTSMAASGTTKKITSNQILGAGGTATLASATITGDLTVDTSTLYVSSSSDKVGIGTTSLSNEKLTVAGNISANAWLGRSNIAAPAGDCSIFRSADNTLGFGIASTTAMTLNSTGLGVGGSPTSKLSVFAGADGDVGFFRGGSTRQLQIGTSATAGYLNADNGSAGFELRVNGTARAYFDTSGNVGIGVTPSFKLHVQENASNVIARFTGSNANGSVIDIINTGTGGGSYKIGSNFTIGGAGEFAIYDSTAAATRLLISSTGNVGIGVAPSAWTSAFGSVLQFKSAGSSAGGSLTGSSADNFRMFSNTYYDGAYKYIAAGFATQYEQSAGSHVWYLSGTTAGAINGAITFSTALSLDKTGSLVLGSAAVATTATDGFLYIPSCAGAPTGVPTTKTGRVPMVVDSTNNRFYVYVGGTWKYTTLA